MKLLCTILSLFLSVILAEENPATLIGDDGKEYKCGTTNSADLVQFKQWEDVYVCLVFDNVQGQGMKKVMFTPKMDFFEVLEVQGLFDLFKDEDTVSLIALTNGKISRPTFFKY